MGILALCGCAGTGAGAAAATVVAENVVVVFGVAAAHDGEVGVVWVVRVAAGTADEVKAFVVAGGAGGASGFFYYFL